MDNINSLHNKLKKQHYEFIGNHSAVKICEWTKKSIRDEGVCYKQKFYGIRSHLCCQMSVTIGYCQNMCIFCWRELENSLGTTITQKLDNPKEIIDKSKSAMHKQLIGFYGLDTADKDKLDQTKEPMHYAISLTGDALIYPRLNELIKLLHKQKKTTFIVTNGILPDRLKTLEPPTQLYISVDAPNKTLFNKIDRPILKDAWEKLQESLSILKQLKSKTRTTLRLTLIKNLNMTDIEGWSKQILKADPNYVEVKAYMFVGSSRQRLSLENMPRHNEVKEFSKKLCQHLNYKILDEQEESRVVLIAKKDNPGRVMKFQ